MELKGIYQPIEGDLVEVKEEIRRQLGKEDGLMKQIIEDIIYSPGKLLRPTLALLAFSAGNNNRKDRNNVIKAASMIELIHTATLIHDDVIDETTLRRHRTNLHTRWGDKISVLFGDYLFSRSFTVLCRLGYPEIVCTLADTINLICEGELKQINRAYDWNLTEEDYLYIVEKKTASFFSFSCFCGGRLGKVAANEMEALASYGLNFGIAFQIVDDCLDFIGDEKVMGKSLGSDLRKGKITLPLIYLLNSTSQKTRKKIIEFITSEQKDTIILVIKEILQKHQVMHRCAKKIMEYVERAKKEIKKLKDLNARKSFLQICDYALVYPVETLRGLNEP